MFAKDHRVSENWWD